MKPPMTLARSSALLLSRVKSSRSKNLASSLVLSLPSTSTSPGNLGNTRQGSSRLVGGFALSAVKSCLLESWGLRPQCTDVILLGTAMELTKHLGPDANAKALLDGVIALYAGRSVVWRIRWFRWWGKWRRGYDEQREIS